MAGSQSTKAFYERSAESYAAKTAPLQIKHVWDLVVWHVRKGSLLLDLGCGAGRDLKLLSQRGFYTLGLDFSLPLLRIAQRASQSPVVLSDIACLPFRHGSLPAVLAVASLLHIPQEQIRSALREISRVLAPEGILISTLKLGTGEALSRDGRLFVGYTPGEWDALLRECCFVPRVTRIDEAGTQALAPFGASWMVSVASKNKR